jgi:hypothetical protein
VKQKVIFQVSAQSVPFRVNLRPHARQAGRQVNSLSMAFFSTEADFLKK